MISFANGVDEGRRQDRVAQPPAGHRVRLGEPVEHDRPVGEAGQRRDRDVLAVVDDPAVDLVGEDGDLGMAQRRARRSRSMSPRVNTPPVGLRGRVDDQQPGPVGHEPLELVEVDPEVVLLGDRVRDGRRARRSGPSTRRSGSPGPGTRPRRPPAARASSAKNITGLPPGHDDDAVRGRREALARRRRRRRSPRAAPAARGTGRSGSSPRRAPASPPPGRWPACRSRARRSRGG